MPVGPLRLETLNQSAIDREAQIQGAPAFSKLRRALLQTSTIAATEDNPAKKREMLRAAMEGAGTGFSDVSLAAHRAALNKVSMETDIANRGLELTYQADVAREAQATGIASQEKMQGLSLAEAREAQKRGISAEQAMQEKSLAASKAAQRAGITSAESMAARSISAASAAQERGITAQQAMQERGISAGLGAQLTGITSQEKMQGLSLAEAREAQVRGISTEQAIREQDVKNQLGIAGFNAEIARANLELKKPLAQGWVTTPWGKSYQDIGTAEEKEIQWKRAYQNALNNFYASR